MEQLSKEQLITELLSEHPPQPDTLENRQALAVLIDALGVELANRIYQRVKADDTESNRTPAP